MAKLVNQYKESAIAANELAVEANTGLTKVIAEHIVPAVRPLLPEGCDIDVAESGVNFIKSDDGIVPSSLEIYLSLTYQRKPVSLGSAESFGSEQLITAQETARTHPDIKALERRFGVPIGIYGPMMNFG